MCAPFCVLRRSWCLPCALKRTKYPGFSRLYYGCALVELCRSLVAFPFIGIVVIPIARCVAL